MLKTDISLCDVACSPGGIKWTSWRGNGQRYRSSQSDSRCQSAANARSAVMALRLPQDLKFDPNKTSGSDNFVLYGDPNKPGSSYAYLQKWYPHSMSRPHFHENDRYIYVISGTWWLGWGPKYDPDHTYPVPTGSFVHHFGRQLHLRRAKDEAGPHIKRHTQPGHSSLT